MDQELIKIAAEAGAKAALERWELEIQRQEELRADRRLHNTRLLLQNFRLFRKHAQNAVFQAEQLEESVYDILELMEQRRGGGFVESVRSSALRTATLVRHVEVMLELYRVYCLTSGREDAARRWRVVKGRFVDEREASVQELAQQECVADRTVRRDIEEACDHLAALIFGIDGVQKQTNVRKMSLTCP